MTQQPSLFTTYTPHVVSYGVGVNSTAMLIGMAQLGFRPDLILFADTGSEKPETYTFLPIMQEWLTTHGFPPITTVRYRPKRFKYNPYDSLEGNCLANGTLPSLAFAKKGCSVKWKIAPQNKYCSQWEPARRSWAAGEKVHKYIGYDAGPADIRRKNHVGSVYDPLYEYHYPLIDWGWDRGRYVREIEKAGLPIPVKSSCFFCPAVKAEELHQYQPDLLERIVGLEARAKPRLKTIAGLWRKRTITAYIREAGLLPEPRINEIIHTTPTELTASIESLPGTKYEHNTKKPALNPA